MPQNYYMVLTAVGAAKKTNKEALGQSLDLTELAVGDGSGAYVAPDQNWTALNNEVDRVAINQIYQDPDNATYLVVEAVIPQNIPVGYYIREVGIFDVDGDMIMVGAYPQTYKPTLAEGAARDLYIRAISEIGNTSSVELKIDPSIVLSTRQYVDKNFTDLKLSVEQSRRDLTLLIHPDKSKGLQELQEQGVYPSSFNQQWGGMGYGGMPDGTMGEVATQNIKSDGSAGYVGNALSNTYQANGFKVGQTTNIKSIWINIYKAGNPTNNLELYIYNDSAGNPDVAIANGAAIAQAGHIHSENTDGEWVKFTFAAAPNCIGGTQYHIVLKSSGVLDAANHWRWAKGSSDYPYGNRISGDATPVWTQEAGCQLFIIEPMTKILNSGLTGFDGALNHYEGATLNQSGGFYKENSFMNHKRGMIHLAGTGWNKDKTFYDSGLGTDKNRIVIRCSAITGYAQVDLYEKNESKHTVMSTTDISTGNHIVSVGYRAEGDGADFLKIYINGVSEGVPVTAETITLDKAFEEGHTIIGGGFPIAPAWTGNEDMSGLPSSNGWTFTGTATEANVFIVNDGILYQNGAGYATTETGYYVKNTTLNNATGWIVDSKIKLKNSTNNPGSAAAQIAIKDGTKYIRMFISEYFCDMYGVTSDGFFQHDFTKETFIRFVGKGSNYYVYINGKLAFDGTGLLVDTTATNQIFFGDENTTTTENASAEWHYLKYYEGAHFPEYSNMQLSEMTYWTDDKSSLLPKIYNSGLIQSVKTLAGINKNYINPVKRLIKANGITKNISTTVPTASSIAEMSAFCFGSSIKLNFSVFWASNTLGAGVIFPFNIDGVLYQSGQADCETVNYQKKTTSFLSVQVPFGLHSNQVMFLTGGGTLSLQTNKRNFTVESA